MPRDDESVPRRRNYEDTETEENRKQKKRHKKKQSRREHHHEDEKNNDRRKTKRSNNVGDESSTNASPSLSASSSESDRHRRRKRKHRKKDKTRRRVEEKKKKKRHKKEKYSLTSRGSKDSSGADDTNDKSSSDHLQRNHALADSLLDLLQSHPGMASELPAILIRLAGGTTFDLRQMPDTNMSRRLQRVLAALAPFGVVQRETGTWQWQAPAGGLQRGNDLLLIKIARSLLDQIGITAEAVKSYTQRQEVADVPSLQDAQYRLDVQSHTQDMLETFGKTATDKSGDTPPTLAQEFAALCTAILNGDSVSLDGLSDERLRAKMEQIFDSAGLEKSEMQGDSDHESQGDDTPTMGFGLPDEDGDPRANLQSILEACKTHDIRNSTGSTWLGNRTSVLPAFGSHVAGHNNDEDEDEEGPAPVGCDTARRRVQQGCSLPPEIVRAMAARRQQELEGVMGSGIALTTASGDVREEWMMEPGEHEFLQGIKSGAPLKNRSFQNTKQSRKAMEHSAPVDPMVKAEMDVIMKMHREARGPTLIEQHRRMKAEEKASAQKTGQSEWNWNRDADLDAGRRVDKNALSMVMGGAQSGLKDKFQGGY